MAYRLAPSISVARIDDALIFLDLTRDRYFRVPLPIEQAMLCLVPSAAATAIDVGGTRQHDPQLDEHLHRAVALGVLVQIDGPAKATVIDKILVPTDSVLEAGEHATPTLFDFVSVAVALAAASRRLRRQSFSEAIGNGYYFDPSKRSVQHQGPDIAQLARRFERVRRTLPVSNQCLRDSLALRSWLARRGYRATLTLGVANAPFAAHCWLQTDTEILNETSDGVRRFIPILAIA